MRIVYKLLYYMPVKYRHHKQICQTLAQNTIQLNKSVTNLPQLLLLTLVLSTTGFLFMSCGRGDTTEEANAVSTTLYTVTPPRNTPIALPPLSRNVTPESSGDATLTTLTTSANPATSTVAITPVAATQVAEEAAAFSSSISPLATPVLPIEMSETQTPLTSPPITPSIELSTTGQPTVTLTALLSETVDVQGQMAISMALMARSLMEIIQQPVDSDLSFDGVEIDNGENTASTTLALTPTVTFPLTTAPPLPMLPQSGIVVPVEPNEVASSDDVEVETTQGATPEATPYSADPAVNTSIPLGSDGQIRSVYVPILMYHYLSVPPENADIYRRDLSVSPELFAAHLDRMIAEGYTVIPLRDLVAHLLQGTPLPPKAVVITFDDGYRDNYEHAFPLLRERNLPATFFLVMEFINQGRPEYLTWDMVTEMAAGGMDIEVHGVDHTTLRGRSQVDLEFQAVRSLETIQNLLNYQPRFLSYPAGEYDEQTIDVFRRAGYWAGLTTVQGATHSSSNLFKLSRVRIRGTTTPDELVRLLAVDW